MLEVTRGRFCDLVEVGGGPIGRGGGMVGKTCRNEAGCRRMSVVAPPTLPLPRKGGGDQRRPVCGAHLSLLRQRGKWQMTHVFGVSRYAVRAESFATWQGCLANDWATRRQGAWRVERRAGSGSECSTWNIGEFGATRDVRTASKLSAGLKSGGVWRSGGVAE